jgi:hypothetical protein
MTSRSVRRRKEADPPNEEVCREWEDCEGGRESRFRALRGESREYGGRKGIQT